MQKKYLPAPAPFSVLKKTQREMHFSAAANASFSPYSSFFFSHFPPLKKILLLFLKKNLGFLIKNKRGLFLCLFLGVSSTTFSAYRLLSLQEKQEEILQGLKQLEKGVQRQKKDLAFLQKHRSTLQAHHILTSTKKWTRFDMGEQLKKISQKAGFQDMVFTVMPEKKVFLQGGIPATLTKISVSYKTRSDTQLISWIQALNTQLIPFIVPRQLTIDRVRVDAHSDSSAFEGVEGVYTFDWVKVEK